MATAKLAHAAGGDQIGFLIGTAPTVRQDVVQGSGQRTQTMVLFPVGSPPSGDRWVQLDQTSSGQGRNDAYLTEPAPPTIPLVDPVFDRGTGHALFDPICHHFGGHAGLPMDRRVNFSGDSLGKLTEYGQVGLDNPLLSLLILSPQHGISRQRQTIGSQCQFWNRRQETLTGSVR